MNRRRYLATGLVVALAGCTELGSPDEADTENGVDDGTDDESDSNGDDDADDGDDHDEEEEEEEETHDDELVGTFDDFEDLDAWYALDDIGSITADTEYVYEGSQSARLEHDDGQVRVRRSLDEPIDVRGVVPGLATTAQDRGSILIQLQDEDGDYLEFSQQVMDGMPLARHNFGLTRVRGDPDLSEIIVLQIIHWGDEPLWVDDFHFVPKPDTGRVMLQFHGGYEAHYTEALSILEEYDLPATAFVPTGRLRPDQAAEGDRLTYDQVGELASAGWTIGSHSAQGSQLADADSVGDDLESNVVDPIDWLEEEGYADDGLYFAFPGSVYHEAAYELVQENYDLAFAGQSPAQGYAANPHLCSMVANPDPNEAVDVLEWTAEWGGITTLAFFQMEDEEVVTALENAAAALAELVEAGDLQVITPEQMADEFVFE